MKKQVVTKKQPWEQDEPMTGPLRTGKKKPTMTMPSQMGISSIEGHASFATKGIERQAVNLAPYKEFIHCKYKLP